MADSGTTYRNNILDLLNKVNPEDRRWNMGDVTKLENDLRDLHDLRDLRDLNDLPVFNTAFTDFSSIKGGFLIHISNHFQARQKRLPQLVETCLKRISASFREAMNLRDDYKRQQDRGGLKKQFQALRRREPGVISKIIVWKARFDAFLQELEIVSSTYCKSDQIVSSAARLLQPVPDSGFVGSDIQNNREKLEKWLGETSREARVMGVYGTAGVGKTSLLKIIYNSYKKEVSRFFDVVIWFTMSRNFEIEQLQASIAEALNLSLEEAANNAEAKKMKLNASLEGKKYLLILDNMRQEIDLNEVGVKTGDDNGSKLLISSRDRDLSLKMDAKENYLLEIKTLSAEDGWDLFKRGAFNNGDVPENIAKEIANNCKGLPLVINAVAAAMRFKTSARDWSSALASMRTEDTSLPTNQRQRTTIDAEHHKLLRWIYNEMPDPEKSCFLNCAAFLEDKEIAVETLVAMWDAEGLLNWAETPDLMDAGRQRIESLVSRCLVEYVNPIVDDDYHSVEYVKIHQVFRDMAIDIGQREGRCLFETGQRLQSFPTDKVTGDCRRISVARNAIRSLPNDLNCKGLESLVLASNIPLEEVPQGFFLKVQSLKVLDLSSTSIRTLPQLEQLTQLQFLNLSSCSKLVDLPDSVCSVTSLKVLDLSRTSIRTLPHNLGNLSGLQVLNLNFCSELQTLPNEIDQLKSLKHIKLDACFSLTLPENITKNISQLTSLNTLILPLMESTCAMSVTDLLNLSNLVELTTVVKAESDNADKAKSGNADKAKSGNAELDNADKEKPDNAESDNADHKKLWSKMRNLTLEYEDDKNAERGKAGSSEHVIHLKENLELQNFHLINYKGKTLPSSICKSGKMKLLLLRSCYHLEKLLNLGQISTEGAGNSSQPKAPPAPDQSRSKSAGDSIQSEASSALHQITSETAGDSFPILEKIVLKHLLKLQRIAGPSDDVWIEGTMSKLQLLVIINCPLLQRFPKRMNLPELKELHMTMCNEFVELDVGSFPKLELLALDELNKLESIAGPSEWNSGTMSKLQIVEIIDCPSLEQLPAGMETLPKLKQINGELDWWRRLKNTNEMKMRLSQLFMMI